MSKCRYAAIKDFDINQSPGVSVSLWMQGCEHRCDGCYNMETWDFDKGEPFTDDTISKIIHLLTKDKIHKNFSILGGETLSSNKIFMINKLLQKIKDVDKSIQVWLWTGYLFEDILNLDLIKNVDYLIDGKYMKSLHEPTRFKGSSNQRIINVKESLKQNKIVLYI